MIAYGICCALVSLMVWDGMPNKGRRFARVASVAYVAPFGGAWLWLLWTLGSNTIMALIEEVK